jgi:ribosome-binding protein aMBF1 (putative translation factor)
LDLSYTDDALFMKMLGVCVKEAREERGLSQAAFAKNLGISQRKLREIEDGLGKCRPQTLRSIQDNLGLEDSKLERMLQVARIRYIGEFMELVWEEDAQTEEGAK